MAPNPKAPIEVRPRPSRGREWLWIFPLAAMAAALVGCGGRRQSMRPVYVGPAATVGRPCTNCGGGTSAIAPPVVEESDLAPAGLGSGSSSVVEEGPVDAPAPSSSVVPKLPQSSSGGTRSSAVESSSYDEKPPKATIDREPAYSTPSTTRSQSAKPTPKKPSTPDNAPAPELMGPTTRETPKNSRGGVDARSAMADANASGRVRRTSLNPDLRPFMDNSTASELAFPARADRPWKYIVLHHSAHTEGSYEEIDREHRKVLGYEGCGYHFVIGNGTGSGDGEIQVAQRWINQKHGVHCRNAKSSDIDEYGIGICLVGDFEQEKPTPRQIAATKALITYLSERYHITDSKVETHAHLASTPTVCPGKLFPTDALLAIPTKPNTAGVDRRPPVPTTWRPIRRSNAKSNY